MDSASSSTVAGSCTKECGSRINTTGKEQNLGISSKLSTRAPLLTVKRQGMVASRKTETSTMANSKMDCSKDKASTFSTLVRCTRVTSRTIT